MLMAVDVRPELLLYWVEEGAIVCHQKYQRSAVWRRTVSAAMLNALIWPFLEPHSGATEAVSQETSSNHLNRVRTISSSPSSSSVAGSGIGPSIVQRFDSYFVLMKFSIFLLIRQHPFSCLLLKQVLRFGGNMSRRELCLPIPIYHVRHTPHRLQTLSDRLIRPRIPPSQYTLQLLIRPSVQVHRFNSAYVCAHSTMYARAPGSRERYSPHNR